MATKGYCGRIIMVLKESHKKYALVQCGDEYVKISKCDFEDSLARWIDQTKEQDEYKLWYNYDLK